MIFVNLHEHSMNTFGSSKAVGSALSEGLFSHFGSPALFWFARNARLGEKNMVRIPLRARRSRWPRPSKKSRKLGLVGYMVRALGWVEESAWLFLFRRPPALTNLNAWPTSFRILIPNIPNSQTPSMVKTCQDRSPAGS